MAVNPTRVDEDRPVRTLLSDQNFLCIWLVGGVTGVIRWFQLLAFGVYSFEITGSPLLVSAIPILWMLPLILFGPFIGVFADQISRKLLLSGSIFLITALQIIMSLAAFSGDLSYFLLALASFVSGIFWATDMPIRRRLLGDLAGRNVSKAMGLDSATGNATRMLGPLIGGVVYQWLGLSSAFAISTAVYVLILVCVLGLPKSAKRLDKTAEGLLFRLIDGFSYARRNEQILGVLLLTAILNFFAFSFAGLVPVWAVENFDVDPIRISFLVAAEGGGAFCGAIVVAYLARPARFQQIFFFGAVVFVGGVLIVAKLPVYGAALAILFLGGVGISGFGAMQSTIVLNACPPAYRSRVMGVVAACIGAGPLGVLHLGWLAEYSSASSAVLTFSITGMALIFVIALRLPGIRR